MDAAVPAAEYRRLEEKMRLLRAKPEQMSEKILTCQAYDTGKYAYIEDDDYSSSSSSDDESPPMDLYG